MDLSHDDDDLGGRARLLPNIADKMMPRYVFWTNMDDMGQVARELCALAYYKSSGWIWRADGS